MSPKRLVLFVEGHSDVAGASVLVERLLKEQSPWDCLYLDPNPMRVGGIESLSGNDKNQQKWRRFLGVARQRKSLGAVLLILDCDADRVEGENFCAATVARRLCQRARDAGAGTLFSVACVFAMRELESWLIAGIGSLAGKNLPDSRPGVRPDPPSPPPVIEARRNAKGWLNSAMLRGYKQSIDQMPLARMVDLEEIRGQQLRSFEHLEHAIGLLVTALRSGNHILSPSPP
jgi:hypothetical protein